MTVGERIKNLRLKLEMSQVDFANKIGVSKQTLYKYENNIITNIPSDKIECAARLGNVSPASLMGWSQIETARNLFCGDGSITYLSNSEKALISLYEQLNNIGKKEAYKRIEELTLIDKYTASNNELLNAAHARTDTPTPTGQAHDNSIMDDNSEWE